VLEELLARCPPFDALTDGERRELAAAARVADFGPGELVLDAFRTGSVEVFVVVAGHVDVWSDADRSAGTADRRLGPGGLFGFSAMLTERSVGPRVVAVGPATVAALPAALAGPAFLSRHGAAFLAAESAAPPRADPPMPSYRFVDDLLDPDPPVVAGGDSVADVAARMTERGSTYAVVRLGDGFGLVTDATLRRCVLAAGRPGSTPAAAAVDDAVPTATAGDSAAEAQILMLDHDADHLLVTARDGALCGVVTGRRFSAAPTAAGVSVHEQIRHAATEEELRERARLVPGMLADLLAAGLASARVIAVHSAVVDTVVRRAIGLVFARHPDLSRDAFTWLALGSNGRREAVLSSDVDSAVAFDDALDEADVARYRPVLAEVDDLLAAAGLSRDEHGAGAGRAAFARTNAQWRAAALRWRADPAENQGAIMASLLVDGRPIHGDPGLPAVSAVFTNLRRHRGTMRLLLEESLSARARARSLRDVLARRDVVDLKTDALLPIVNTARWAALSAGSAALSTTDRLRAAAGSLMLPQEQAANLVEAFDVVQRLRLRYQLIAHGRGEPPTDVITRDRMSPIDRSVVDEAVREIAAVQRRMDNIAVRVSPGEW
jgi:CBS domain-containing protein